MFKSSEKLPTPTDYGFPYTPYDIQQQLMKALFSVVEDAGVAIVESPTGTGKSLTLTCAALTWQQQHEALVRRELLERIATVEAEMERLQAKGARDADWIDSQYKATQQFEDLRDLQKLQKSLQAHEKRLKEMRESQTKAARQQRRLAQLQAQKRTVADDQSTEEANAEEDDPGELAQADAEEDIDMAADQQYRHVQIFFCSRTHSQLAQVVREVKRTAFGRELRCVSLASRQQLCINTQVRRLPSAALLNERCLDMARSCSTANTVAERATNSHADGCAVKKARLQRMKNTAPPSASKCAFKAPLAVQQLSELALTDVLDIEELVHEGEVERACPYYAARGAVHLAQLVMLPYQMLLHRRTRLQSGIDLRGAVVIIDEAHNLLDTIAQLHSCELTLPQLLLAQHQIGAYKLRFATRFSTANLLRINQLLFIARRLVKLLQPVTALPAGGETRLLRTYQLTSEGDFFNIDLFELLAFCERSRLAQKLQSYAQRLSSEPSPSENLPPSNASAASDMLRRLVEKQQMQQQNRKGGSAKKTQPSAAVAAAAADNSDGGEGVGGDKKDDSVAGGSGAERVKTAGAAATDAAKTSTNQASPIRPLLAFLEALTDCAEDGRVLVNLVEKETATTRSSFKYILLNPGSHFEEVLRDARAIIVAGGTMQPTAELKAQLFHSCPERVRQHFYDHVVPPESVLPMILTRGPRGRQLCFNYGNRGSEAMLSELAMILTNACNVVPAGVVCFLPSYEYLNAVYVYLQRTGVWEHIDANKVVFCEPRTAAAAGAAKGTLSVEQVLAQFAAAIATGKKAGGVKGALLLSVVGGKLSEGLNFADDLGRAVIVVGLPYPSKHSPELRERMRYLDDTFGADAGNEYYENLCMKAVNQCIGRSVRHIRDYACVLLLDERYAYEHIRSKLPHWIKRSLQVPPTYGAMQGATARFFKAKRSAL